MSEGSRIEIDGVDMDAAYQAKRDSRRVDTALDWLYAEDEETPDTAAPTPAPGDSEPGTEEPLPTDDRSVLQRTISHFSPIEAAGGVLDAFDENFNTIRKLSESGNEFLMERLGIPGLIVDEDGVRFTRDADELHATDDIGGLLPDLGDKENGSFARGIGQFAGNFIGLGKAFKGMGVLQGTSRAAMATNASLRSALGTFAGFEGMDNPVNGLVEAFPSAEGNVTEFLDSDEEDPELLNKLRNALLDAGAGAAVDGAMFMLRTGRQALKAKGSVDQIADDVARAAEIVDTAKSEFKELLGDPDNPNLIARNADELDEFQRALVSDSAEEGDVFINWSRIDSEDDVKQIIQDLADADAPKIHQARRGVQTNEATEALADQENAWKILEDRRASGGSNPLNAEQSVAVRRLWTSSGAKTLELAQRVQAGGGANAQTAFRKMLAVHATIQEQVIAARTETARALQSWRIPSGEMAEFSTGLDDIMRQVELDPATKRLAEGLTTMNAMGRTAAADQFVYGAGRMGKLQRAGVHVSDITRQLWYGALLSGPHTHMRNMIGNTGMSLLHVAERGVARSIGKNLGDPQVADGETAAMAFGMIQAARDAFRMTKASREAAEAAGRMAGGLADSIRTGDSGFGIGKVDARPMGALSAEKMRVDPDSFWGKGLDYLDTATQLPTRGLAAADEVFKASNYRGELMAQAHRQAAKELHEGVIRPEQFADRLTSIVNEPDEFIKLAAVRQAQEATFTAVPKDTGYWRPMKAVAQTPVLGKILLPFSRTPYNIAIESIERTPLAPFSKKWREDLLAGGARTDIAMAKMSLGTMFLAASADLAANGYLTGDMKGLSVTPGERAQRGRLGERSMSLMLDNGRTFSFRGLDPLTFSLGVSANVYEILNADDFASEDKDGQDVVAAAVMAIGAQFSSANYMQGVSSFFEAMGAPSRYSESYFERLVGSMVPTGVAHGARGIDPTLREVNTWWEAVMARTPLLSLALEPKVDAWGRERTRESGLGKTYDFGVPIYSSKQDVAIIDKELDRLGIVVNSPSSSVSFGGVNVSLKRFPKAYTALKKMAGNEMRETVDGLPIVVKSIGYTSEGGGLREELDSIVSGTHSFSAFYEAGTDGIDGDKANFIQSIVFAYRKEAKRHLIEDFPELQAEVESRADERTERNFGQSRSLNLFGN